MGKDLGVIGETVTLAVIIAAMLFAYSRVPVPDATLPASDSGPIFTIDDKSTAAPVPSSSYKDSIYLETGNASDVYQPYEEYISIRNSGRNPVNITGWRLTNAKGERAYDFGGTSRYFPSDSAVIPQASLFVSPIGLNLSRDVILEPYETAVITTGQIAVQLPYRISSFKENICSGYLEDLSEYQFSPPLKRDCPRPSKELGVSSLDTECRRYIERMSSCHTPKFETRDSEGNICTNCVDGTPLSGSCVAFIKNHFNYGACIAYHQNDPNFSGRTWRIFLGRGWEMWAKKYETIKLFDRLGRLVDSQEY